MTSSDYPSAPLMALDTVWFQVAGTICNLQCTHCFISCSPTNHAHEMMTLALVKRHLEQAETLGAKEYYFTGGEPFMNPEIFEMIEAALRQGPVSVLTNGVLFRPDSAQRLRRLSDASEYSLDLRISIDGYDAASNDPIRGAGTFQRILNGIRHLAQAGLAPVITVTEACEEAGTREGRAKFLRFLTDIGLPHPRLKVMPLLRLGAEQDRSRPYTSEETLAGVSLTEEETYALQCTSCRMVTAEGVWVCPILLDSPEARMGDTLAETISPFELRHQACHTCHVTGLSCKT
jgi:sulfatase maturation enzyme AslB (radical SAM superfamily)